jgi:hypothetical protein
MRGKLTFDKHTASNNKLRKRRCQSYSSVVRKEIANFIILIFVSFFLIKEILNNLFT